jgi:hypothetical protein
MTACRQFQASSHVAGVTCLGQRSPARCACRAHFVAPAALMAADTEAISASDGCKAVNRATSACRASQVVCSTDSSAVARPSDSVRNSRSSSTMPPLCPPACPDQLLDALHRIGQAALVDVRLQAGVGVATNGSAVPHPVGGRLPNTSSEKSECSCASKSKVSCATSSMVGLPDTPPSSRRKLDARVRSLQTELADSEVQRASTFRASTRHAISSCTSSQSGFTRGRTPQDRHGGHELASVALAERQREGTLARNQPARASATSSLSSASAGLRPPWQRVLAV